MQTPFFPLKSISDDDLCSDCAHCRYEPGEMSACALDWPGEADANGYIIACSEFKPR